MWLEGYVLLIFKYFGDGWLKYLIAENEPR